MARQSLEDSKILDVLKLGLTVVATKQKLKDLYGKACSSDKLKELKIVLEKQQKARKSTKKHGKSTDDLKSKPKSVKSDEEKEQKGTKKARKSTSVPNQKYLDLQKKYDFLFSSNATLLMENQELQKKMKQETLTRVEAKFQEKIFGAYIKQYRTKKNPANAEIAIDLYQKITGKEHPTPLIPPLKEVKK